MPISYMVEVGEFEPKKGSPEFYDPVVRVRLVKDTIIIGRAASDKEMGFYSDSRGGVLQPGYNGEKLIIPDANLRMNQSISRTHGKLVRGKGIHETVEGRHELQDVYYQHLSDSGAITRLWTPEDGLVAMVDAAFDVIDLRLPTDGGPQVDRYLLLGGTHKPTLEQMFPFRAYYVSIRQMADAPR